jgi:hypothetical protein
MIEIFKEFEYLHEFKFQTFQTALDDSLILNTDLTGNKFSSVVLIPFFRIKKKLYVEKFLAPFDGLSNSKKTKIKKLFIEGIKQEIQNSSIQSKFHIIQKDGATKYIRQLRPINLTKSKYIYLYESLGYKSLIKNF